MDTDRTRQQWVRTLEAHVRAVHAHEVAATLRERLGDPRCADVEAARAAAARNAHARTAALHPEWSHDVSAALIRGHYGSESRATVRG